MGAGAALSRRLPSHVADLQYRGCAHLGLEVSHSCDRRQTSIAGRSAHHGTMGRLALPAHSSPTRLSPLPRQTGCVCAGAALIGVRGHGMGAVPCPSLVRSSFCTRACPSLWYIPTWRELARLPRPLLAPSSRSTISWHSTWLRSYQPPLQHRQNLHICEGVSVVSESLSGLLVACVFS